MLTAGGRYVADHRLEGQAHACFVRSPAPHGQLADIDTDEARDRPGVLGVFTADDLGLADLEPIPVVNQQMGRPLLARGTVRFAGEPVVAVVAETAAAATDAAEHVIVDVEPLPAVVSLEEAAAGTVLVHARAGTNLAFEMTPVTRARIGPRDSGPLDFSECEAVVRATFVNQRLAAAPLEPRSASAHWRHDTGRLTFLASTQAPHRVRDTLAELYGLAPGDVRVIAPDVGGGFGAKASPAPEELLLAGLSRVVGRPVVWTESRSENLTAGVHGRAQVQKVRLGGDRSGRITHYELDVTQDAGAYPIVGAYLPAFTRKVFTGCYDIANASVAGRSYVTNTAPIAAYRGAGRPEAVFAVERAVDLFAAEIGADPADVRRRNLLAPEQLPYTNAAGSVYDTGDYPAALRRTLDAAGYAELRAAQARLRASEDPLLLGVGMASYVESTSMGAQELGEVELAGDGTLVVRTGATPFGQGHATCWQMIASSVTGLASDRIAVVSGDTDQIASGGVTAASRSAQLAGSAVLVASKRLVEMARRRAAAILEAADDDVVLDRDHGAFHVAGSPSPKVTWADVAAAARADRAPLVAVSDFEQDGNTYPFGCHVAVVEVDSTTGEAALRRLVACDDAGTLINPMIAEGQVHGGIAQGAAQALLEAVVHDSDGNPLTANLTDYPAVTADVLPSFELVPMETPTFRNPLGAKGIGESGTIGAGPAVLNAVCDAVAHLGVAHIDMPACPQRVWRAING